MVPYTVLDAYGTPIRWGECPLHLATGQADAGETVLYEHPPTPESLFVDGEWIDRPPKPPRYIGWDSVARQWIVPVTSIEETRAAKNREITAARVAADLTTFPFMGEDIQCDQGGRSQIDGVSSYIGLFGSLPPGFPGAWKTLANNYLPIPDVPTFKAMVQAMVAQGIANFVKSEMLKAYVNDPSRTIAEIDAVTW